MNKNCKKTFDNKLYLVLLLIIDLMKSAADPVDNKLSLEACDNRDALFASCFLGKRFKKKLIEQKLNLTSKCVKYEKNNDSKINTSNNNRFRLGSALDFGLALALRFRTSFSLRLWFGLGGHLGFDHCFLFF